LQKASHTLYLPHEGMNSVAAYAKQ